MMDDRVLWLAIRRALLMIVKAIEVRYGLGTPEPEHPLPN
jgi:hypothetical protein